MGIRRRETNIETLRKQKTATKQREGTTGKTKKGKDSHKKEIERQRKQTRTERIDEIQWENYSVRQIYSSDVRRGGNDRERQSKERTDVGKTKNDRNSKQSR